MDLIVSVPADRLPFVKKLLRELNLPARPAPGQPSVAKPKPPAAPVPRPYTPEEQQWIDDFREALHEVELHQQGKIQLQTLDEFIHELRNSPDQEL